MELLKKKKSGILSNIGNSLNKTAKNITKTALLRKAFRKENNSTALKTAINPMYKAPRKIKKVY